MAIDEGQARVQRALTEALSEHPPHFGDARVGVLTGFVVVSEWMDEQGERWLASVSSDGMASWQRDGMLHSRLYDWPVARDED